MNEQETYTVTCTYTSPPPALDDPSNLATRPTAAIEAGELLSGLRYCMILLINFIKKATALFLGAFRLHCVYC